MKKKVFIILAFAAVLLSACNFKLRSSGDDDASTMKVERYDRLESRYVITGDFSALQQMNTEFPIETRTLVEKMLRIGEVSDHDISERFLRFYQDSTLQMLVNDVESEYANMDDINQQLQAAFTNLQDWIPNMPLPRVYSQIGALDQSIVIGDRAIGISLDKYMGPKYPLYQKYGYSNEQLESMGRSNIVPDAVSFYLLSLYPLKDVDSRPQIVKDLHVGKAMWVTNKAMGQDFFTSDYITMVNRYMHHHPKTTVQELLADDDYSKFLKK